MDDAIITLVLSKETPPPPHERGKGLFVFDKGNPSATARLKGSTRTRAFRDRGLIGTREFIPPQIAYRSTITKSDLWLVCIAVLKILLFLFLLLLLLLLLLLHGTSQPSIPVGCPQVATDGQKKMAMARLCVLAKREIVRGSGARSRSRLNGTAGKTCIASSSPE